jgi:iron complex outermembrane receptor protein
MYRHIAIFCCLCACELAHGEDLFDLSLEELQSIKLEVASLFEDSALDVASSTAVLYKQDWQQRGVSTLGQALEAVPSVAANTTWGGSEVLAIRGYATELSVRGIAYTMNGIPLGSYTYANTGYSIPRMPLPLIQQIEMIRGPGSAIYGNDAFHGVLSFELANAPISQSSGYTQLGANNQQVSFLNSQFSGQWQVHSGIAYEQDGPYEQHYNYTDPNSGAALTSEREQSFKNTSAYLTANYGDISNQGKWSSLLFYNEVDADGFTGIGRQFFLPLAASFDLDSASLSTYTDLTDTDSQFLLTGLSHEVLLNNQIQIKNQVYFWQSEHLWTFDNRGYPDTLTTLTNVTLPCKTSEASTSPNPLYCQHIRTQQDDEQRMGYQVQIKQKENAYNTQWVIGAGYDEIKITDSRFERRDLNGNLMIGYDNAFKNDERFLSHLFAQGRTGFDNNTWLLSYGVRWDNYSDADEHTSPRVGLVHKINDQWRQKLLYGHAYRAPTALELKGSSSSVLGNSKLKPEIIDTYEYVLMYHQPDFQLEAVVFGSEWHDAIALEPVAEASSTNQYQNIKDNHAQGLELSLNTLMHSWLFKANASYVQSENKSDDIDYQAFPQFMMSINAEHQINNTSRFGLWYRHMQDYALGDNTELFTEKNERYQRIDLYASHKFSSDTILGINLFNLMNSNLPIPSYYGSEGGLEDKGREINLYLEQRF